MRSLMRGEGGTETDSGRSRVSRSHRRPLNAPHQTPGGWVRGSGSRRLPLLSCFASRRAAGTRRQGGSLRRRIHGLQGTGRRRRFLPLPLLCPCPGGLRGAREGKTPLPLRFGLDDQQGHHRTAGTIHREPRGARGIPEGTPNPEALLIRLSTLNGITMRFLAAWRHDPAERARLLDRSLRTFSTIVRLPPRQDFPKAP